MNAQFPFDNTYSTLPSQFFHKQKPATVSKATLVACNFQLAKELEIKLPSSGLELIFSGQMIPDGADPLAQAYEPDQLGDCISSSRNNPSIQGVSESLIQDYCECALDLIVDQKQDPRESGYECAIKSFR